MNPQSAKILARAATQQAMTDVMEFRYNRDQIMELTRILKDNRRLSAALSVAVWTHVMPKETDPILILELLERIGDVLSGANNHAPFAEWVREASASGRSNG